MKYILLVLFLFFLWITKSTCDCGLTIPLDLQCMARYDNYSQLCHEGNSHNPNVTSNTTLPTYLNINNTYLGEDGLLYVTINDTEGVTNTSYNFLFCVMRTFSIFTSSFTLPVNSCYFNDSTPVMNTTVKWQAVTNLTVFVFTSIDNGTVTGCDYKELFIKNCSESLDVSVLLSQDDEYLEQESDNDFQKINKKPDNITSPLLKIGNVTVHVDVTATNISNSSSVDTECTSMAGQSSNYGSTFSNGSSTNNDEEQPTYQYTFYFPGGSHNRTQTNHTNTSLDHYFNEAINSSIFVEVVSWTSTDVRYGKQTIKLVVYEPVNNPQVAINGKYIGENIPFTVEAEGSKPIQIEWILSLNGKQTYCEMNNTKLINGTSETFNCMFDDTGQYEINAKFNNSVSTENINISFTISQPPPINVVATSTSAVAVLIVVIILVILAIVLVATFISYRKFRNKSTEIADFSFVNLNRPSRWKRFSFQASQLKERFSKRNKRFGLVNTSESGETLDSFYGSLNPFAAHETL